MRSAAPSQPECTVVSTFVNGKLVNAKMGEIATMLKTSGSTPVEAAPLADDGYGLAPRHTDSGPWWQERSPELHPVHRLSQRSRGERARVKRLGYVKHDRGRMGGVWAEVPDNNVLGFSPAGGTGAALI
ncbi:MAG: hypothetical protein RJA70_123 [Pseudomonadota bacterium]|jgi:hypothetical protein